MSRIVSSIPGRIRLRDRQLRNQTQMARLIAKLKPLTGIKHLQSDHRTGSVLVFFESTVIENGVLEKAIDAALDEILGKVSAKKSLQLKKHLNRYNKLAMLTTLGASLAIARIRPKQWKRWHVLTAYGFLANLALHLVFYRKSLFRLFR
jgi:hypothetical protein